LDCLIFVLANFEHLTDSSSFIKTSLIFCWNSKTASEINKFTARHLSCFSGTLWSKHKRSTPSRWFCLLPQRWTGFL